MPPPIDDDGYWYDCKEYLDTHRLVSNGKECSYRCNPSTLKGVDKTVPKIINDLIATCEFGIWSYREVGRDGKDEVATYAGARYDRMHPYCPGETTEHLWKMTFVMIFTRVWLCDDQGRNVHLSIPILWPCS